jgi:hypothetical protein
MQRNQSASAIPSQGGGRVTLDPPDIADKPPGYPYAVPTDEERMAGIPQPRLTKQEMQRVVCMQLMPDALKALLPAVRDLFDSIAQHDLRAAYSLGQFVAKWLTDEAEFGSQPVEGMATILGVNPRIFYLHFKLAQTFTSAQIEAFARRPLRNRSVVTVDHLALLAENSPSRRADWTRHMYEKSLTPRQLRRQIEAAADIPAAPRRPPRPLSMSPLAAAKEMSTRLRGINARMHFWKTSLLDELLELPPDRIDDAVLCHLLAIQRESAALQEALGAAGPQLDAGIERVERVQVLKKAPDRGQAVEKRPPPGW